MTSELTWLLKEIAKDPKLSEAFDTYNLDPIYEYIVKYASNGYEATYANRIKLFTDLIIDLGVDPLQCVTYIHKYMYCKSNITAITIPSSVFIGTYAFVSCKSLINMVINSGIETIGDGAFKSCVALPSIEVPNSVTTIGSRVFENCRSLGTIRLSSTLTHVGAHAFYHCESLHDVYYNGTKSQFDQIDVEPHYGYSSGALMNFTIHCSNGDIVMHDADYLWC